MQCAGLIGPAAVTRAHAANEPYDVVFLDWYMPAMTGFDLLRACRQQQRFDRMAIIMLTAESEAENITRALEAGATAYITKPFDPSVIVTKLNEVMAWQAAFPTVDKRG
jgi:DNA-binding response OmpR family regulator